MWASAHNFVLFRLNPGAKPLSAGLETHTVSTGIENNKQNAQISFCRDCIFLDGRPLSSRRFLGSVAAFQHLALHFVSSVVFS